jgi:hypothetical protein
VGNRIVYSTHLFQNATVPANHPPDAPHGLSTHIEGDTVVLSWHPGTDTEQRGGLTYNVRLAPESGGADVVSPLSAPDGWCRVARAGNAGGRTSFILRGLKSRQRYHWSVQSVDSCWAGSPFAPDLAFNFRMRPVASNLVVTLREDAATAIPLAGWDADSEPLTFTILSWPTNGTLQGVAPYLTYHPNSNATGLDLFTYQVSNSLTGSFPATIRLEISPVNDPPVADATATARSAIAGNGSSAMVTLNASRSSDVETDPLSFEWRTGPDRILIATGVLASTLLPAGAHSIQLTVSDRSSSATNQVVVEVITAAGAIRRILLTMGTARPALLRTLSAAGAATERGNRPAAINHLRAAQKQVRAQIARLDPALAERMTSEIQAVIEALIPFSRTR